MFSVQCVALRKSGKLKVIGILVIRVLGRMPLTGFAIYVNIINHQSSIINHQSSIINHLAIPQ
jgi:hypothetical protein